MSNSLAREKRIMEILDALVREGSITCTNKENLASEKVVEILKENPYFKEHPELTGIFEIEGDGYNRFVPYGLIIGNKKDTVVLGGHTDVVSVSVYGESQEHAFSMGEIKKYLDVNQMNDQQKEDFLSEQWIWGRGVADMKGGVAINLWLMEENGKKALEGQLEGSLLFIAVPDEESYSAGMRAASKLLLKLKNKHDLKYKLLIDPEPAAELGDAQVMSLGSVGKCLPVIMVQGQLAHIGHGYNGISALNMLTNMFKKTNGSLEFSDQCEGEACMPPIWANLRDLKEQYDVSIPERAYGYFTVLSFDTTVMDVMDKLKSIGEQAFIEETERQNNEYQQFKKINKFATKDKIYYEPQVYTLEEFKKKLKLQYGEKFDKFLDTLYEKAEADLNSGSSYPDVTVMMMEEILEFANIKTPLILIGMAPPYYPPTHSNTVDGFDEVGSKLYKHISQISQKKFNQRLVYENYFMGISDNSYTSVPDMDFEGIKANFPMWGKLYSLDFESIKAVAMPSILYGPIGREYHQWTERVNKQSLLEVMPCMLQEVIDFAYRLSEI